MRAPRLIRLNTELALNLGLDPDWLAGTDGLEVLAGRDVPEAAEPIAMAYAGHQFGHFVPQLGDGRAILLGEVIDQQGVRRDIQLKGSGRTPFSRGGDGRAALGPVLREYVVSEAMVALGIPTTRSLAAVITGETVARETLLPGALLTRVATSHIRVGTFEFFAARGDLEGLRLLADHVISRHYPEAAHSDGPYASLLELVTSRQAELIARWLLVGFIHGVMNTDNMSIAGKTIDYGPCAFMDEYHPAKVLARSINRGGTPMRTSRRSRRGIWHGSQRLCCPSLTRTSNRRSSRRGTCWNAFQPASRRRTQPACGKSWDSQPRQMAIWSLPTNSSACLRTTKLTSQWRSGG